MSWVEKIQDHLNGDGVILRITGSPAGEQPPNAPIPFDGEVLGGTDLHFSYRPHRHSLFHHGHCSPAQPELLAEAHGAAPTSLSSLIPSFERLVGSERQRAVQRHHPDGSIDAGQGVLRRRSSRVALRVNRGQPSRFHPDMMSAVRKCEVGLSLRIHIPAPAQKQSWLQTLRRTVSTIAGHDRSGQNTTPTSPAEHWMQRELNRFERDIQRGFIPVCYRLVALLPGRARHPQNRRALNNLPLKMGAPKKDELTRLYRGVRTFYEQPESFRPTYLSTLRQALCLVPF